MTQAAQHERHWKDRAITAAEVISDAFDVAKAYGAHIANWILFFCLIANLIEMVSPAFQAIAGLVIVAIQSIMLDIAGFGLTAMAASARRRGDDKSATKANVMGWTLITVMAITVGLVTLAAFRKDWTSDIDQANHVLMFVRVIVTVFYGHIVHQLREESTAHENRLAELEGEVVTLQQQITAKKQEAANVQAQLSNEQKAISSLQHQLEDEMDKTSGMQHKLDLAHQKGADLERELETGQGDTTDLRREVTAAKQQAMLLTQQMQEKDQEITLLQDQLTNKQSLLKNGQGAISDLEGQLQEVTWQLQQADREKQQATAEKSQLLSQVDRSQQQVNDLEKQVSDLTAKLQKLTSLQIGQQVTMKEVRSKKDSGEEATSQGTVLQFPPKSDGRIKHDPREVKAWCESRPHLTQAEMAEQLGISDPANLRRILRRAREQEEAEAGNPQSENDHDGGHREEVI
jgi:DNA repair exonuclease SbcCD ATPase subunit